MLVAVPTALAGTPNWLPLRAPANIGCAKDSCGGYHGYWAVDLLDPERAGGEGIYAAGSGKVARLGVFGSCLGDSGAAIRSPNAGGTWVEIDHGGGVKSRYFHLRSITVKLGQAVTNKTKIGTMGNTGASTCRAPHLHFEKTVDGKKVNPGTLYACHGSKKVSYSNWNGSKGSSVRSDGVGCGVPKDTDKDGVPDSSDKCKTKKGPKSNRGCPLPKKPVGVNVTGTYSPPIPGDFNGDGYTDILWYGPGSASDSLWFGTATKGTFETGFPVSVKGTYKPISGDFNGDGYTDILWYGPGSADDNIWFGTSAKGTFDTASDVTVKGTYSPPIPGDFNGDGYADILWYGPGSADDNIWFGTSAKGTFDTTSDVAVKGTYKPPIPGDFNGDGHTDILWYGPGSADDNIWFGTSTKGTFDTASDVTVKGTYSPPVPGDFNGDRYADILWYGPGSADDNIWYGSPTKGAFDTGQDVIVKGTYKPPIPGDFNGDGYADVLWYAPGSGADSLWFGTAIKGTFQPVQ